MWHYSSVPPRVTVIIATYNRSAVLRCAVASVLAQTFTDFELLVVGDGCTDDSEQVVGACGDPRVRWINLPVNTRHQSAPNNEGLRQARGELIAYLGHDDLWLPHHLAAGVAALDAANADLVCSLAINVMADGTLWPKLPVPARSRFASPLSTMHRRAVTETLGGWRSYPEAKPSPDVDLWQRAHDRGFVFTFAARLTGIKFPASVRRDVYATCPSHEQEAWLARIRSEPDLEPRLLSNALANDEPLTQRPYSYLVQDFLQQTLRRLRVRFTLPGFGIRALRNQGFERTREFKGLKED